MLTLFPNIEKEVFFMTRRGIRHQAAGLCAVLLLSGCGTGFYQTEGEEAASGSAMMEIAQVQETDATPAGLEGHTVRQLTAGADGEPLLVTTDAQAMPHAYQRENGEWQEQDNAAIVSWVQENQVYNRKYYYDTTGSWWAVIQNGNSIVQVLPDGQSREVVLPEDVAPGKYVAIYGFADRGDGLVCFAANQTEEKNGPDPGGVWFLVDSDTGQVTQTFSVDYGMDYRPVFYQGDLVIYDYAATTLKEYDAQTGQLVQEVPIERPDTLPAAAAMTEDGIYHYFVGSTGLYRRPLNGDFTQTVTDDILLNCMSSNFEAMGLYVEADGAYLIAGNEDGKMKLYNLSIQEGEATAAETTLTVWAMESTPMLQIAAQRYQSLYPEVKLNIVTGRSGEEDSVSEEDILRQLNTELLSGEGPDCLILDGLPVQSYIRQGMLQNLDGLVTESECYSNILNGYAEEDGLYAVPAFFAAPVFATVQTEGVPASLEELARLFDSGDCTAGAWKELFEVVYPAVANRIFPDGERLDEAALSDFLEQTKRMVQSAGITQESMPMASGTSNLMVTSELPTSRFALQEGTTTSAIFRMTGISQAVSLLTQREGVTLSPLLDGTAEGQFLLGIRAGTQNLPQAQDFVRMMLEDEQIQQSNVYGGMAVHRDMELQALQQTIQDGYTQEERDTFAMNPLEYSWDELAEKYTELVNPAAAGTLQTIVYEQAVQVYGGQITPEKAVEEVKAQVKIYLQEQA